MKLRGIALLVAGSVAVGTMIGVTLAGATAAGGAVEHTKVIQRTFVVRQGHQRVFDITCPSGYVPVGGGGHVGDNEWLGSNPAYTGISESDVDLAHTGWAVTAFVTSLQSRTSFTADAVCATWSS
ncbi:MAG TPA: hypothetical protein VMR14_09990 [Streptosporangiaceae bacterium]|jgi:hypothetical protein|nr:hypothetical protein [Streptosporangiaceae bacterium]